jgi:hypothetical protein
LLTLSFSSYAQFHKQKIPQPFLNNEIIPFAFQPNFLKLYDFLIYPSNDGFKNYILPFLSSEKLLKFFLYFQNLDPNIRIQKFLPYSTVTTTAIDFQNSYIAYIFENEFSFFNPIICDSEEHYRTVTLGCGAVAPAAAVNHTEVNSIYALFPSNKIFRLDCHLLSQNQKVVAAVDEESSYFFVVVMKNSENKLTFIAKGTLPREHMFSDDLDLEDRPGANEQLILNLDCFWNANNLNYLKKFYFKVFYLYDKFIECIKQTRWSKFMIHLRDRESPWQFCPVKMLWKLLFFILFYIGYFPLYHVNYFPFYTMSLPFAFVFFQDNFMYSGIITKHFIFFWTIPSLFGSIHFLFYFKLYISKILNSEEIYNTSMQTKPPELKWAVSYFMSKKPNRDACIRAFTAICSLLEIFVFQFLFSLPFAPFMMMQEAHE